MISTALAGLAGLLIAPLFSVHSDMGTLFGIKAFAVAILGGITSASGVMLAGLVYGLIEALVTSYLGSVYTQIVAFSRRHPRARASMPNGLIGPRRGEQGLTMRPSHDCMPPACRSRSLALTAAASLYAAKSDGYTPFVLAMVALTAVVGVGLNILVGLTGQISLGHVGFYAIGAYTVAILTLKGVSFWIALPVAGLIAGAIGLVLALPALRVSGPYLAMVTIAFAFIVQHGAIEWRGLTGGANGLMGLAPPSIGSLVFAEREMAMLAVTAHGRLALCVSPARAERLGQGDGGGARCRSRRALDRAQSRHRQDRGLRAVRGVRRASRRDLRAAADVRGAGFVSVLAIDPVPVRGHRRAAPAGRSVRSSVHSSAWCCRSCCRSWPNTGCCSSARRCW